MVIKISQFKQKSFTLIEMLVTMGIILIMVGIGTIGLSSVTKNTAVATNGDELKRVLEEMKSFANGPDRERAAHYILIIKTTNSPVTESFCNKNSTTNALSQNQYMICSTQEKTLPADKNTGYSRVRAANLDKSLAITSAPPNSPIVVNIRTFDGQMGYNLQYCDTGLNCLSNPSINITLARDITKTIVINAVANTVQLQ